MSLRIYSDINSQANESVDVAFNKLPIRTQPRISAFIGEETVQYLVLCEHQVLCKVSSLQVALFTTFAAYYCFNLEYPSLAKNVFSFLQDYILSHPDSNKKPGAYLATVSDIKRNLQ